MHCGDLTGDREIGAYWEKEFCKLAAKQGRSFTPHQIGRPKSAQAYFIQGGKYHPMTLPDITVWTRPGEHHEIKHKDPCAWGFGLERYRLDALRWFADETGQSVYYTIHDYSFQPDRHENYDVQRNMRKLNQNNDANHWLSRAVVELADADPLEEWGYSYVNGVKKRVPICYWPKTFFEPVMWMWLGEPQRDMFGHLVSVQAPPPHDSYRGG